MNINERLGITWKDEISHREKYGKVVTLIGLDNLKPLMPYTDRELANYYAKDKNLNNIKLKVWDSIAGNYPYIEKTSGRQLYQNGRSPLKDMLHKCGINTYSPAELVCTLKEAATEIVEEYMQINDKAIEDTER